jgi:hypothetical protein
MHRDGKDLFLISYYYYTYTKERNYVCISISIITSTSSMIMIILAHRQVPCGLDPCTSVGALCS